MDVDRFWQKLKGLTPSSDTAELESALLTAVQARCHVAVICCFSGTTLLRYIADLLTTITLLKHMGLSS